MLEKIAVIDLGSNTIRLVIYNVVDEYFYIIDEMRETVRLGQDFEQDGYIKANRIEIAKQKIKTFKRLCDAHKVDKIYAVTTSAVRRAKNQRSFLEEIMSTCGIRFEVLSEEQESNYIYTGVINSVSSIDFPKGLIMEMGGGSTNFIYYNRKTVLNHISLPFGSITLTDMFKDESDPKKQSEKIEKFFKEELSKINWFKDIDPETQFIGVGGAFRNLGKINRLITHYPLDMTHEYFVSEKEFNKVYDLVRVLDLTKKKIKGLSGDRADIFPSTLAAIKTVFNQKKFSGVTLSACGLREGIMFNHCVPSTVEKPIQDVLEYSVMSKLVRYSADIEHAKKVRDIADELFKLFRVLHKFSKKYVRILEVAALMHDSGRIIKQIDHHKHSAYLILNTSLHGILHKDIILAAMVAGSHRKADFNKNEYAKYLELLDSEEKDAIEKLGIILRMAECLDRGESGIITSINSDILGDSVIIKIESQGDASLEMNQIDLVIPDFKRIFGKTLSIIGN